MTKKLLIDTTHSEETRVAVVDDTNLEEFDYENKVRKQLKGNIFLAQVTRVEPSLQAAFVNFGGNRHGFLPFSEIHPDYFRIPVEDREALQNELAEEAEKQRAEEEREDYEGQDNDLDEESAEEDSEDQEDNGDEKQSTRAKSGRSGGKRKSNKYRGKSARSKSVEVVGGDDDDETRTRRPNLRKKYKIQEVVKRGQIMLIQVSKEERGNKGAAVTTYISLAGRYCVLMPNSPRAGGVSRKIPSYKERKRMRATLKEMSVPDGMSVIVRTAGVGRTKAEIKRDLNYLLKLWEQIREDTLQATAPAQIHEEANLIKRAIRDLYTRDIDEVYVAGQEGYKEARNFMKLMIPSHAKKVKLYEDERIPLFHRHQVESQISAIGDPVAPMKSGGYLVINPTEALVSVDVNSGRATKERHIEETALKTNMEAAEEVARQLRLRDLGGLVVIDFIDMEDRRNNRKVENQIRDALSRDRARIQVGRISNFGLMELSRQRLNPSLTEAQFQQCPSCKGVGVIRTLESATLNLIRELEEEGIKDRANEIKVGVPDDVALYILNNKREHIAEIESRYGFRILIEVNNGLALSEYEITPVKDGKGDSSTQKNESQAQDKQEGGKGDNRRKRRQGSGKPQGKSKNQDNQGGKKQNTQGRKEGRENQKPEKDSDTSAGTGNENKEPELDKNKARDNSAEKSKVKSSSVKSSSSENQTKTGTKDKGADSKKTDSKKPEKKKEDDTTQKASASSADSNSKSKSEQDNKKPQKSHPDEKVTVIPDTSDDKQASASQTGKSARRKGWWNRLVDG